MFEFFNPVARKMMEINGQRPLELDDEADQSENFQCSQWRNSMNPVLSMETKEIGKQCQKQNFLVDAFSSLALPSSSATLPSSSATVTSNSSQLDLSTYLRVYDIKLQKCLWYIFKIGTSENCHDEMGKSIITQMLEEEDTSWDDDISVIGTCIYKFDGTDVRVLDTKDNGRGFGSMFLAWKKAPSTKMLRYGAKVACLHNSIYVIDDLRGPPFNFDIPNDGWIEVLRPQSTEWQLLSSPPPKFRSKSTVFFHGVDVLDKLIFGSFEENILYFYDSNGIGLEKVKNFSPHAVRSSNTIIVGKHLIWLMSGVLYVYDLLEKKLGHERIVGLDDFVRRMSRYKYFRLVYLNDGRFCAIFLDSKTTKNRTSVIHFLEFSLSEPFISLNPNTTSSYTREIRTSDDIQAAFVIANSA